MDGFFEKNVIKNHSTLRKMRCLSYGGKRKSAKAWVISVKNRKPETGNRKPETGSEERRAAPVTDAVAPAPAVNQSSRKPKTPPLVTSTILPVVAVNSVPVTLPLRPRLVQGAPPVKVRVTSKYCPAAAATTGLVK
ncbi:MAG: hypothetical protein K0Q68_71 [Moraxellaceae bacterium]|nr:hypothetical protein [Moraxellaceae bacterium]